MRGRRKSILPPFYGVDKTINTLEERVVFRMVQPQFTLDDVVNWLFDPEAIDQCRAAYRYVRPLDRGGSMNVEADLPIMAAGMVPCALHLTFSEERLPMLVPDLAYCQVQEDRGFYGPIRDAMAEVTAIHLQFNKMRKVAGWVESNLTVTAARDYVPWLGGALPKDHAFHDADGKVYKEPAVAPDAEMLGYMRECGALMGSALLCAPLTDEENASRSTFSFRIERNSFDPSQMFWLL